ncbi:hypothetical protein AND4_09342 [Vibrio sp. AND4]|nr:hypothetical protein AND4_09342 [Vibrio sp. AND4]
MIIEKDNDFIDHLMVEILLIFFVYTIGLIYSTHQKYSPHSAVVDLNTKVAAM